MEKNLPELLSAKDAEKMGLSRPMVYLLLNRKDVPVIQIGRRKFFHRDMFLQWLSDQAKEKEKKQ